MILWEWERAEGGHYTGRTYRGLITHIERAPSWGLTGKLVVFTLGATPKRSG